MAVNEPQVSKRKIHQIINLKKIFGYKPNELEKEVFYQKAVDTIVRRTTNGNDRFGSKFARYSKDWAEKKGVTRGSVDLTYTGAMLSSFRESVKANTLKLQISPDQTPKAYNHIVGDTVPRRDFFGINQKEAEKIKREVQSEVERDEEIAPVLDAAVIRAAVQGISGGQTNNGNF